MTDHPRRPDFIRWTVTWIGFGTSALGFTFAAVSSDITNGVAFTYLHTLTAHQWGLVWGGLGVVTICAALLAWRTVLVPLLATVLLLLFWSAQFFRAAATHGGHGYITAVTWAWLAGIIWLATIRAAKIPNLTRRGQ